MNIDNYFSKYLRRNLNEFWANHYPQRLSDEEFTTILNYMEYLRKFEKNELYIENSPEYQQLFMDFVKNGGNPETLDKVNALFSNKLKTLITDRDVINKDLKNKLDTAQYKISRATNEYIPTLKLLYKRAQYISAEDKEVLKLVFKAGQDSMEGYIKPKDAEHEEDTIKLKQKHTFNFWANHIWKYGKSKGFAHLPKRKPLKYEDLPEFLQPQRKGVKKIFKNVKPQKQFHVEVNNNQFFGGFGERPIRRVL